MSAIDYRPIAPGDYVAVRQFLAALGWERRVSDPGRFVTMMEREDRTVVALEGGA